MMIHKVYNIHIESLSKLISLRYNIKILIILKYCVKEFQKIYYVELE